MDDKDDPYRNTYSKGPSLPPFSSLAPRSAAPGGGYGTAPHQQQQPSVNHYMPGSTSCFNQHTPQFDFSHPHQVTGLQSRKPVVEFDSHPQNRQFYDNISQGPHFQARHQLPYVNPLQQPPLQDMSLSLPFSVDQSNMLGGSHLPASSSFSNVNSFPSSTDHPPQIPLSQVESLLSEAEQKPLSDFGLLQQTLDEDDLNISWGSSYHQLPTQSSEQLLNFNSFPGVHTKTSSTVTIPVDTYLKSETQSKSSAANSFDRGFGDMGNSTEFTSNALPEFAFTNPVSSQFEHRYPFQGNYISPAGAGNSVSVSGQTYNNSKSKKKKKVSDSNLDNKGNNVLKKTKRSKKSQQKQGMSNQNSVSLSMNCNNERDISAAVCLSPTFIASLSSKRAPDSGPRSSLTSSNVPVVAPCLMPQSSINHSTSVSRNLQNHFVPGNSLTASTTSADVRPVPYNSLSAQSTGSQKPYPSSAIYPNSAQPVAQGNDSRIGSQICRPSTNVVSNPGITSTWRPGENQSGNVDNNLTIETRSEDRSPSPFQLSPGFLASLSSKRADEQPKQVPSMGMAVSAKGKASKSKGSENQSSELMTLSIQLSSENSLAVPDRDITNRSPSPNPISPGFLASLSAKKVDQPCDRNETVRKDLAKPQNSHFPKPPVQLQQNPGPEIKPQQSPKSCKSPPPYPEVSEFQYPTPPMEEDESKGQSPGLCLSPTFLASLSNKTASYELCNTLTPTHDTSALPTPPNSAGPKQPPYAEILSKEEQTSRILEIIAREREKAVNVPPVPVQEPKKKKKKKKSRDPALCMDDPFMQFPGQTPQPFDTSKPFHNAGFPQQALQGYTNFQAISLSNSVSEIPATHAQSTTHFGPSSMLASSIPLQKLTPMTPNQHEHITHGSGIPQPPEGISGRFQVKRADFHSNWDGSFSMKSDINSQPPKSQKAQICTGTKSEEGSKDSHAFAYDDDHHHHHKSDSHPNTSQNTKLLQHQQSEGNGVNVQGPGDGVGLRLDPYAFDDSEYKDVTVPPKRQFISNPGTCQTPENKFSGAKHELAPNVPQYPVSENHTNVTEIPNHISGMHKGELSASFYQSPQSFKNTQVNLPLQHNRTFAKHETLFDPNTRMHLAPEAKDTLTDQHLNRSGLLSSDHTYPQSQQNDVHNKGICHATTTLSQYSQDSAMKQECVVTSLDVQSVDGYHNGAHRSVTLMNVQSSQIESKPKTTQLQESMKKKRGRPSKQLDALRGLQKKPKLQKPKVQAKNATASGTTKIQYKVNGVNVKPDDLKLNPSLVDRLANNLMEVADCTCLGPNHIPSETTEGPYYTQLGAARDVPGVRKVLEQRTGAKGSAIRIEKVIFTGKEGKSKEGCPVAKWIIRRSGPEEKYLCIVRKRPGHFCDTAVIIVVIVAWEGVALEQANTMYDFLINTLPQNGLETDRRCGLNEKKTCACQGVDLLRRGASFSFGCSWSMYYNGCKFARSQLVRKFKLKDTACEDDLDNKLQTLASNVAPLYKQLAPDAFRNQTQFESQASDCRLGTEPGRPFSGVTAVVDFCCHSHRDCHNMNNGSTVVVNLTKHRGFEKTDDEQFHVLPLYILDQTDEEGSMEGQIQKIRNGSLEVLSRYMSQVRMRSTPYRPSKRNRTKKQNLKKGPKKVKLTKAKSFPPGNFAGTLSSNKDSSLNQDGFYPPPSPVSDKGVFKRKESVMDAAVGVGLEERSQERMSYTDLMSQQENPGFRDLYTKFWDYFYTHGVFPPREWTTKQKFLPASKVVNRTLTSNSVIQPPVADQMFLHQQQEQRLWQHQEQQRQQLQHQQRLNVQHLREGQQPQQEQQQDRQQPSQNFCNRPAFHVTSSSSQAPYPLVFPPQQQQQQRQQQLHLHAYQPPSSSSSSSSCPAPPEFIYSQSIGSSVLSPHNLTSGNQCLSKLHSPSFQPSQKQQQQPAEQPPPPQPNLHSTQPNLHPPQKLQHQTFTHHSQPLQVTSQTSSSTSQQNSGYAIMSQGTHPPIIAPSITIDNTSQKFSQTSAQPNSSGNISFNSEQPKAHAPPPPPPPPPYHCPVPIPQRNTNMQYVSNALPQGPPPSYIESIKHGRHQQLVNQFTPQEGNTFTSPNVTGDATHDVSVQNSQFTHIKSAANLHDNSGMSISSTVSVANPLSSEVQLAKHRSGHRSLSSPSMHRPPSVPQPTSAMSAGQMLSTRPAHAQSKSSPHPIEIPISCHSAQRPPSNSSTLSTMLPTDHISDIPTTIYSSVSTQSFEKQSSTQISCLSLVQTDRPLKEQLIRRPPSAPVTQFLERPPSVQSTHSLPSGQSLEQSPSQLEFKPPSVHSERPSSALSYHRSLSANFTERPPSVHSMYPTLPAYIPERTSSLQLEGRQSSGHSTPRPPSAQSVHLSERPPSDVLIGKPPPGQPLERSLSFPSAHRGSFPELTEKTCAMQQAGRPSSAQAKMGECSYLHINGSVSIPKSVSHQSSSETSAQQSWAADTNRSPSLEKLQGNNQTLFKPQMSYCHGVGKQFSGSKHEANLGAGQGPHLSHHFDRKRMTTQGSMNRETLSRYKGLDVAIKEEPCEGARGSQCMGLSQSPVSCKQEQQRASDFHSHVSSGPSSACSTCPADTTMFDQSKHNHVRPQNSSSIVTTLMSQSSISSTSELWSTTNMMNGQRGNIDCENGPATGELMKVHKSEGFVRPKLGQGPSEPPYEVIDSSIISVETDDNKEVFGDPAMGGVAIALCHGAVLFEVAKRELHATTALKEPNRYLPKRISLVFYQHKNLNLARHGFEEYEKKAEERRNQAEQARLIEEMEAKGFLKGELGELASFPNLTKGTFGKVFNFPEARETLFPLRFPRYLDCSPLEQITPVMFACMSIAFPKYMKGAFPSPSTLPRLMSGCMPIRMASSLSDNRKYASREDQDTKSKKLKFRVENFEECGGSYRELHYSWNPQLPPGDSVTTSSVIDRWVHDDTSVTGPYNRWVELTINQEKMEKEDSMQVEHNESEADLKEKMPGSISELDSQIHPSGDTLFSGGLWETKPNRESQVNLEANSSLCTSQIASPQCSNLADRPNLANPSSDARFPNIPKKSNVESNMHVNRHTQLKTKMQTENSSVGLGNRQDNSLKSSETEQTVVIEGSSNNLDHDEEYTNVRNHNTSYPGGTQTAGHITPDCLSSLNTFKNKNENLNQDMISAAEKAVNIANRTPVTSQSSTVSPEGNRKSENSSHVSHLRGQSYAVDSQSDSDSRREESVYDFVMKGVNHALLTIPRANGDCLPNDDSSSSNGATNAVVNGANSTCP